MGFRTYKTLGDVLKAYSIRYEEARLPTERNTWPAPSELHEEITFNRTEIAYDASEAAICENVIYPILRAVWKPYRQTFAIWSHKPIELNDELSGVPDYIFARKSVLGKVVFDTPYVAMVEAKKEDFTMGWAQCALEMYTIQQLNQDGNPVYDIVSNGDLWEIGVLSPHKLILYKDTLACDDLNGLFSALTYVLETCKHIYNL